MQVGAPKTMQGPEWLAELVFAPNGVVRVLIGVLGFVVALAVVWKLYQDGTPDAETQQQMGSILATAIATATATVAVSSWMSWSYLLDVAAGVVIGSGVVISGEFVGRRLFTRIDEQRRASTAWLSLSSLLWMPLAIVPPGSRASLIFSIVQGGLVVAVGMAVMTAREDF
ncbi:hypothetical protein D3D02_17060 [Halobellus sp. Atlit-38R]|uniref:hypothetical protein n=1 Tax=Halobellus sp. Atlit-38R TaxID=2282131 RepID=UPI000EF1AD99|nr:hypothetical protein [Halobellus sp. Atlit-38R]RLM83712.1 hypothetical protein D3D02_17060 [Halobellus sp. Atlit-38R]